MSAGRDIARKKAVLHFLHKKISSMQMELINYFQQAASEKLPATILCLCFKTGCFHHQSQTQNLCYNLHHRKPGIKPGW